MRRCRRVSALRSSFAGFRFPPEVIMIAVRWYLRYSLVVAEPPPGAGPPKPAMRSWAMQRLAAQATTTGIIDADGRCCVTRSGGSLKSFQWFDQMATVSGVIVFWFPFWPVVAFLAAFALLRLRLGRHWVRVRRAWLGRLTGAAY